MPYSPTPRSYTANPFAATPTGVRQGGYASALRSYTENPFAAAAGPRTMQMAPHLSQPVGLDQDVAAAYRSVATNPQVRQYNQIVPDIDRLWRLSPKSPMFQPGYSHNPFVMQEAERLRNERLGVVPEPFVSGGDWGGGM